ncbi:MAG: TlpA disulfide reductase family protein [Oceanococcaceae bacterium]
MNGLRSKLTLLLVALGAALAGVGWQLRDAPSREFRPDWELTNAAGDIVRAVDFDGRWQLVNFWASWCPPCVQEIPLLVALQQRYPNTQLQVLGPALDRVAPAQVAAERFGINYPVLFGERSVSAWMDALGEHQGALPFSVLIDPQGIIREQHLGALDEDILSSWEKQITAN